MMVPLQSLQGYTQLLDARVFNMDCAGKTEKITQAILQEHFLQD